MRQSLVYGLLLAFIAVAALGLRVIQLEHRPVHHDEANQADRCRILLQEGEYTYDPHEHHGPTLYYLVLPLLWAEAGTDYASTSITAFRMLPVLFGVGLILLLYMVWDGLGRTEVLFAGILTALSPAMVYYSRFFIQETLLVFFTFAAVGAVWRYVRSGSVGWAVISGAFLGLMHATKETCAIAYLAMAIAVVVVALWGREQRGSQRKESSGGDEDRRHERHRGGMLARLNVKHLALKFAIAAIISMLLFSSFFTNAFGPLDSIRTYFVYLGRGSGDTAHIHPWNFYLKILLFCRQGKGEPIWSEALILLLALVGIVGTLRRRGRPDEVILPRFFVIYTVIMVLIYSLIPYKTPWNMLSFLHGLIILAGIGVGVLFRIARRRWLRVGLAVILVLGIGHLTRQMCRTNYAIKPFPRLVQSILPRGDFTADPRNPYVYSQTTRTFLRLVRRVNAIAELSDEGTDMFVAVVAPPEKSWPLPWYFKTYGTIGFWPDPATVPLDHSPSVIITSEETEEQVFARMGADYETEFHGLRPDDLLYLHIRKDLWERFMEGRR